MAGNPSFDALLSTTLQNYRPQLVDNIFKARVLLDHMNSGGRVVMEDGGTSIVEPLIYEANDTVASYSGYDAIDLTPQDGISAAEYQWKQLAVSIAISGIEEAKNRGEQAILKLLQAKIMQAEETIKKSLNDQLFADGSGNGGKDFLGLDAIVATTNNTVGGIDASSNSWWNPYVESTAQALTASAMATAYNTAANGSDYPDIIVTTQTLFEKYENLLTPNVRYQDVNKANLGFQNLMFKSTPVVFDKAAPTGKMFFLNTKYLKLTGMNGFWFNTTDFMKGTVAGVDAKYSLILVYGQLTCNNRSRQAALTAKTA